MNARLEAQVWRRARNRCEYCGFPAGFALVPFQVDHIIAEKHGGRTTLNNLARACFFCNTFKGPNVAGVDPKRRRLPGFITRDRTSGGTISAGRVRSWKVERLSDERRSKYYESIKRMP